MVYDAWKDRKTRPNRNNDIFTATETSEPSQNVIQTVCQSVFMFRPLLLKFKGRALRLPSPSSYLSILIFPSLYFNPRIFTRRTKHLICPRVVGASLFFHVLFHRVRLSLFGRCLESPLRWTTPERFNPWKMNRTCLTQGVYRSVSERQKRYAKIAQLLLRRVKACQWGVKKNGFLFFLWTHVPRAYLVVQLEQRLKYLPTHPPHSPVDVEACSSN